MTIVIKYFNFYERTAKVMKRIKKRKKPGPNLDAVKRNSWDEINRRDINMGSWLR